jgi:glycosyltransferase involved in cell wall biosynthesis
MKICHIINSLSGGGAETHLLSLVKAQKSEGYEVHVISIGPDKKNMGSLHTEFSKIVNKIHRLKAPRLFNPISYKILFNIHKKIKFDVVHTHQPRSDAMYYILRYFISFKTLWVVSIHGKYDTYLEDKTILNFLRKLLMPFLTYIWKKSDHIICISNEVGNWLLGHSKHIKFTVINYWIDLPSLNRPGKNISKVTLGFMGRLNENKGIEDLLEVFTELENADLELLIGGVGKKAYIEKIKIKYGLNGYSNIKFLDYIDDKEEFFKKLHLFVFPSHSEGLGLVLLEAMSNSKLCLTRNVPPMNQILNEEVGFIFNSQDDFKNQLNLAVEMIRNDHNEIDKKLSNQYNLLNAKYSKNKLFKKIERIYINGQL